MPLINKVKELQEQGFPETDIIQNLKEQGFSPLEINQAVEQAKIKTAVSLTETGTTEEMLPSLMEETSPAPPPAPQPEAPEYIYPTPQVYEGYEQYQPYQAASPETITEIAEQIAEEKISAMKKALGNMPAFKLEIKRNIENIDERLKKIETIIEHLQASIIGKVGSFGQNIQDIKQEMEMMQDSFSKALPSLFEKTKEITKTTDKAEKRKRKTDGFEHYLRR